MNSTPAALHTRDWGVPVLICLALGLAWRSVLGMLVPLFPDETYYWEWSRRLAGGYFDHPPAIAWLIAAGTTLFGDTKLGIRFGPALSAVVAHAAAASLAFRLGGARAAVNAALVVVALPVATLGLVLATPDAPLFAFTLLALVAVERALASPVRSARSTAWWTAAGIALGGAFLSKYTAVLLPFGLVIAFALHPRLRSRFAEPGPYIASAIALALFSPVVVWNYANDWASFAFQLGHGFGTGAKGNVLTRELELVGGQLGVASPILAVLMAVAVVQALRNGWEQRTNDGEAGNMLHSRFAFAVIAAVVFCFFAVSATRKSVEANWPALMYPSALVLLASGALAAGRWWRWGVGFACFLLVVVTAQAWRPVLPLAPRKDPIARAHGWDQLAAVIDSARVSRPSARVGAERYQEASELAFHLGDHPQVLSLNLHGRPNQYDLWKLAHRDIRPGDDLVAAFDANPDGDARARALARRFSAHHEGNVIALRRGTGEIAHRKVWVFTNFID